MNNNLKLLLDRMAGGLFLMSIFTIIWAGIAEYNLYPKDAGIVGLLFLIVVVVFVYFSFKFERIAKTLSFETGATKSLLAKKQNKAFLIIFIIEGLSIFIAVNVLINLRLFNYVIPTIALIVGLHFFPLGYVYKRLVDYFIAIWICLFSLLGILLIYNHTSAKNVIIMVGTCCAIGTSLVGSRMIFQGIKTCRQLTLDHHTT